MAQYLEAIREEVEFCRAYNVLLKKQRRTELLPGVLDSIKEWEQEFPKAYRDEMRKTYLRREIEETRELLMGLLSHYKDRTEDLDYWRDMYITQVEKKLLKLDFEAKAFVGKAVGITPERIAHARQYAIENLVKTNRGMAHCPFHRDRHPSMDVRKNFYYCYSCNKGGDVIDLLMELENITFGQAVQRLT